jgi:hypothetical protein
MKGNMLPTPFDRYVSDLKCAEALAGQGQFGAGFDCLLTGCRYVDAAFEAGEAWAPALLRRYQQALADYIDAHGVKMPDDGTTLAG